MVRKLIVWCLSLTLALSQIVVAQVAELPADAEDADARRVKASLDKFIGLADELRGHIDRSQFDTGALLHELFYDEQQIVSFVRDLVWFEQYPGLLRGVPGTLSSRAGNALDQAILLATLLKDAGQDARIVRGEISPDEARLLLGGIAASRPAREPAGDISAMLESTRKFCRSVDLDCSDLDALVESDSASEGADELGRYADSYREAASQLLKVARDERLLNSQDGAFDELVAEAQDYFWVEYRLGPGDQWNAVHPAFAGRESEDFAPDRSEIYADQVPAELLHKFRFEVLLYQRMGSREVEHVLVPAWERPAANASSIPLTFFISSNNFIGANRDPNRSFDPERIETDLFMPYFSEGPVNSAFDFAGNAIPLDAASSAFAGVFQAVASSTNRAAGALSQLGSSPDDDGQPARVASVERVIARFTFIDPSGNETQHQRSIFDSRFPVLLGGENGQADDSREEIYRTITRIFTFHLETGSPSAAQVLDVQLSTLIDRRPVLEAMLAYTPDSDRTVESSGGRGNSADSLSWQGFLLLSSIFDALPDSISGATLYRHEPNLVVHHRTLPIADRMQESIDVVQNGRRSFAQVDSEVQPAPEALLRAGAWETTTEGALLVPSLANAFNAANVFREARRQDRGHTIVKTRSDLDPLDLPLIAEEAINRELDLGYVIVLPEVGESGGGAPLAWWRIDPATGESLGMGLNGEGTTVVEYTIKQRVIAGGTTSAVSFLGCMLIGGAVNAQLDEDNPARPTGGDCVAFALAMGAGAAAGVSVTDGMLAGFGVGVATYIIGKLVDFAGWLE